MMREAIGLSLGLSVFGIILIVLGLSFTLGINRTWWQGKLLSFQESYFWATIPAGLAFIFWAIGAPFPIGSIIKNFFFWGGGFLILVAIVFSLGPPRIVKPKWLRDLEDRHPYHIKALRDCTRNLPTDDWLEIVHNPSLLQQWADEEVRKIKSNR